MSMTITITSDGPLTAREISVLQILLGEENVSADGSAIQASAPKAAAKKATAAPKPAPEPEEDLLGTEGPTLEDAVKRATELVAAGKAAAVKAALAGAGVKRVSELSGAKIATFLDAL